MEPGAVGSVPRQGPSDEPELFTAVILFGQASPRPGENGVDQYGFIAVPGGFGTLDELFEALVLGQTHKIQPFPVVLLRVEYWTPMLDWGRDKLVGEGMIAAADFELMHVADDPAEACRLVCESADVHCALE